MILEHPAFDYASSGQYNIYNCGGDKASQIHDLLDHLYDDLLPAISDSERQYPSLAFQTFYKNSTNAPFVTALLTNVTKGTAMTPAAPPFSPNGSPTFFCVNGEDQFIYTAPDTATNIKRRYVRRLRAPRSSSHKAYKLTSRETPRSLSFRGILQVERRLVLTPNSLQDTYTTCLKNPTHAAIFLGFTPPKQFIVICPVFWTDALPAVPPPETCLSVSMYTNKFRENGRRQRQFRIWILLEELAHYYIYTSTLRKDAPDIYDVNKCFRLAAETAYLNAVSYVYYVASKYSFAFAIRRSHD